MGTYLSSVSTLGEKPLSNEKKKVKDSMEKYVTNSLEGNDVNDDDDDDTPTDLGKQLNIIYLINQSQ